MPVRHPIHTRFTRLPLLAALAGSAACSTGPDGLPEDAAELRLLHATPALGAVEMQVGATTVVSNVTFGQASPVVLVPAGTRRITVRSGNSLLGELHQTLTTAHVNTVVVSAGVPQFSAQVTPDTGAVALNRANIRLVNAVGSNTSDPTLLHVKIKAPDIQHPDSIVTLGMDSKVASYSSLMYFNPGDFTFTFVPQGGATVLAEVSFAVALGETKVVVLEREANGTYRVQVVEE